MIRKLAAILLFSYICLSSFTKDALKVHSDRYFFDCKKSLILSNKSVTDVDLYWKDSILSDIPDKDTTLIDTIPNDSTRIDSIRPDSIPIDSIPMDTIRIDSTFSDSTVVDSIPPDTVVPIKTDSTFYLLHPTDTLLIGRGYLVASPAIRDTFKLFFTELPIIEITTANTIQNEPPAQAKFRMIEPDQTETTGYIGIEYRGGWTQRLPKKSYRLEFRQDIQGDTARDVCLLGMRSDDDWNLQAMANEPLRIRSKTNNALWKKIHKAYYSDSVSDVVNGIDMKYVELFLNGDYQGIYCLGERIDRKQLQLKKNEGEIRGELYKGKAWGATMFTEVPDYDNQNKNWSGFKYEYPEDTINWSRLHDFIQFTIKDNDQIYYANYRSKFDLDNAVDYFILVNLLRATDNLGKNAYIAKYDQGEPYFYVPWDLDGTLGTIWNGTRQNTTNDLLYNGMYIRMWYDYEPRGFREKLMYRWYNLRKDIVTHDSICRMLRENYDVLMRNGVYERESIAWDNYQFDSTNLDYTSQWLLDRLQYMDKDSKIYYKDFYTDSDRKMGQNLGKPTVFPNPASEHISIDLREFMEAEATLFNSFGQLILKKRVTKTENILSLQDVHNGVYYLRLKSTGLDTTLPFIVLK